MSKIIKIATRASELALYQANWVGRNLVSQNPDLSYELVKVSNLPVNHKDSFVKLCEDAVLTGDADVAVHSAKDLPISDRPGLSIGAICERENPMDVLILAPTAKLTDPQLKVGTASPRRQVQMMNYRDGIQLAELRGNVPTRLSVVQGDTKSNNEGKSKFDAIVLAAAGLIRLQLQQYISLYFTPEEMVPAAGQGAILVQLRNDDNQIASQVAQLNHRNSQLCVNAERHCCHLLNADCDSAVGVYASISEDMMNIYAMVGDVETNKLLKSYQSISLPDFAIATETALRCGQLAAEDLLAQIELLGADKFTYKKSTI